MKKLTTKRIRIMRKCAHIALWGGAIVYFVYIAGRIFLFVKCFKTNKVSLTLGDVLMCGFNPSNLSTIKQYNAIEVMSIVLVSQTIMGTCITFVYLCLVLSLFRAAKQYGLFAQKISDLEGEF